MRYRIARIDNADAPGNPLVIDVEYWRDDLDAGKTPPDRQNTFVFSMVRFGTSLVTDDQGRVRRRDGTWVDTAVERMPPREELMVVDVEIDVRDRVLRTIKRYWRDAEKKRYPADHRAGMRLTASDVRELKAPGLMSELGVVRDASSGAG